MSEWKEYMLDKLVFVDPEQLSSSTDENYSFFYIDISSVSQGQIDYPIHPIKFKGSPSRARKTLKLNDVLMSTVRPNLKSFAKFQRVSKFNFVASTGFSVLRTKPETDIDFIYHSLFSESIERQIQALVVGSNYPAINSSDIRKLLINIPDYPTQYHISCILTTCDAIIEKTQAAISKYKAIKQGALHDLFTRGIDINTGKLRPKYEVAPELYKESKLGWVPGEWEVQTIDNVGEVVTGSTPPTARREYYGDEFLFVSPADIQEKIFISKTEKRLTCDGFDICRQLPKNSICVVCIGSTIGKIAVLQTEGCTNQQINSVVCTDPDLSFFYFYSMLYFNEKQFRRETGLQAVPIVNKSRFSSFSLPSTDKNEALEISKRLITIDHKLQTEQTYLQKLQSIKQGLMGDLLSGRRSVNVDSAVNEPADTLTNNVII